MTKNKTVNNSDTPLDRYICFPGRTSFRIRQGKTRKNTAVIFHLEGIDSFIDRRTAAQIIRGVRKAVRQKYQKVNL